MILKKGLTNHVHTSERLKVKVRSLSGVWLFETPWTVVYHTPPSMWFSRQGYESGLPFSSPEDLPDPGIKPGVSCIASRFLTVWATREALILRSPLNSQTPVLLLHLWAARKPLRRWPSRSTRGSGLIHSSFPDHRINKPGYCLLKQTHDSSVHTDPPCVKTVGHSWVSPSW